MVGFLFNDETVVSYDLQRAHSADVWFIKARAWIWGITCAVAAFLIGNILGVFSINVFGITFDLIGSLLH
jgi:hypothetical protein|tara:strand:+ start:831 stop:1040 length:210 start_codon:yes stop_codon:yes gene_type:complete